MVLKGKKLSKKENFLFFLELKKKTLGKLFLQKSGLNTGIA